MSLAPESTASNTRHPTKVEMSGLPPDCSKYRVVWFTPPLFAPRPDGLRSPCCFVRFLVAFANDGCDGFQLIAWIKIDQLHALGISSGLTDVLDRRSHHLPTD